MTTAASTAIGRRLAELLGIEIIGHEGHDLKCACVSCQSSDAAGIHEDTGVYYCYSCQKSLSAFDLCKVVAGHEVAKKIMVDVGLFDPPAGSGNGQTVQVDPVEAVARLKHCSVEGLKAYGAESRGGKVVLPMYDPAGAQCSTFTLDPAGGKGLCAKGRPAGLFLPEGRLPAAGDRWGLVEGPKDASVLYSEFDLLTAGTNGTSISAKYVRIFAGVDVLLVPDRDAPAAAGAIKTAALLHGVAASIKRVVLPLPFKDTGGGDVRDVLKLKGGRQLMEKAIADAQPVGLDGKPPEPPRFTKLLTSAELLAADLSQRFLVRNILVAGQPGCIGGRSKSLKTSVAIDLAVSLGSGTPFLDRFQAEQARVGVWSGESGAVTIRNTAIRVAQARGLTLDQADILWSFDLPKLSQVDHIDALRGVIDQHQLAVVLVDPLYLSLLDAHAASGASNLFFMGAMLQPLAELGQATGCTIVVLHHFRKGGQLDELEPAGLEQLSQAGIGEWTRQWILLQRRSPYQGDGLHELWMRAGGSAGHASLSSLTIDEGEFNPDTLGGGRKWDVLVESVTDASAHSKQQRENRKATDLERREDEYQSRVVEALQGHPAGETPKTLRTITRLNPENLNRALYLLGRGHRIEPCMVAKAGREHDGFKLRK